MPEIVNIHDAKMHLPWRVRAGKEIILAKAGKPYARLALLERPERELGFVRGKIPDAFFEALPDDELDAWG